MSALSDLIAEHVDLDLADIDHLQRLVGEWQLLADMSFADLLLWVPGNDGDLHCVAQARPTTGPTAYEDDQIGRRQTPEWEFQLAVALREERICREADPDWDGDLPVRREAIPVRHRDVVIAVLSRDTNLAAARSPSALELAYLQGSAELCQMIAEGRFPSSDEDPETHAGPRVGDGLLRLDGMGVVTYASPNGLSAYRRLGVTGDVRGEELAPLTCALAADPFEGDEIAARIRAALAGETPARTEVEAQGATMQLRALPLRPGGERAGALVLVRDVTDVRRRDRELMSKDATIREIHHRVKNNLQTVAALLRLQSRRVNAVEARLALQESVRRVSAIAVVHETLSQSLDERVAFDEVVDRLVAMVGEVAAPVASARGAVSIRRQGDFGELVAQLASPLSVVLTELMQNAAEHAFIGADRGEITVSAKRGGGRLIVKVTDDGSGLPEGFNIEASERLGLQIVRTLVDSELRGTVELARRTPRGTEAIITVPLGWG